jgi:hypothetical protein
VQRILASDLPTLALTSIKAINYHTEGRKINGEARVMAFLGVESAGKGEGGPLN